MLISTMANGKKPFKAISQPFILSQDTRRLSTTWEVPMKCYKIGNKPSSTIDMPYK